MTDKSHADSLVRRAKHDDAECLGRLGTLLIEEHHAFDERRFLAPTDDTSQHYAAYLKSRIDNPNAVLLVAEHDGEVIGYAYAEIEGYDYMALRGPAAVLHDLIIDPKHRGSGVGTLLITAMFSQLESQGALRVVLSTAERNKPAQRLFERIGFRRTMVEMTRELDAGPLLDQSSEETSNE